MSQRGILESSLKFSGRNADKGYMPNQENTDDDLLKSLAYEMARAACQDEAFLARHASRLDVSDEVIEELRRWLAG